MDVWIATFAQDLALLRLMVLSVYGRVDDEDDDGQPRRGICSVDTFKQS